MADILICSTPAVGHLAPLTAIGGHLVSRGHRVRMITGGRFAAAVTDAGIDHVPLRGAADIDDRDLDAALPGRRSKRGLAKLRYDIDSFFIATMLPQWEVVQEQFALRRPDVVLCESGFTAAVPIIMSGADRPPVISCGVIPLMISSPHTPPFGPGIRYLGGPLGRARNRLLNAVVQKAVFGDQQRHAQQVLGEIIPGATLPVFFMDWQLLADSMLQLTVPGFEYPRPELAGRVRFAGPVLPRSTRGYVLPTWWSDLDGERPVVLVTQGTIDTGNLDRVIGPTLRALADEDILVVAATGGPPVERLGPLPANARVEGFIPFDQLLPHASAMVTNGGYGGIHYALAHGVPLVVAGDSEDKPEAAARIAWSGAGVNLHTGDPSEKQLAQAVGRLLHRRRYRHAAQRLAREIAEHHALQTVAEVLERAAARGTAPPAK